MFKTELFTDNKSRKDSKAVIYLCLLCLIAIISIDLIIFLPYWENIKSKITWSTLNAIISIGVLLIMAWQYFSAYRLYQQNFYLFLSIGWLANLGYILFGQGSPIPPSDEYSTFRSFSMLLALSSDIPLFLSARLTIKESLKSLDVILILIPLALWSFVFFYIGSPSIKSDIHVLIAIIVAFSVMLYLFLVIKKKFDEILEKKPDENKSLYSYKIFVYSFLVYALLQLTYLVVFFDEFRYLLNFFLGLALIVKIGNVLSLTSMMNSDYIQLNIENDKLQQTLRQKSVYEELGLLTSAIEHELRTPIGVIKLKLDSMREKYQNDSEIVASIDKLENQRKRILAATRIIKTLRGSADFFSSRLELKHLGDLLRHSANDVIKETNAKNIFIEFEEKTKKLFVNVRQELIVQAFVNIIKNSIESIMEKKNSGTIKITFGAYQDQTEKVFVSIKDNGVGFPQQDIDKLTEPDFSTKGEERTNSGMGLFVCERIINLHKGAIKFIVPDDGGAEVLIILPRAETKKEKKRNS